VTLRGLVAIGMCMLAVWVVAVLPEESWLPVWGLVLGAGFAVWLVAHGVPPVPLTGARLRAWWRRRRAG